MEKLSTSLCAPPPPPPPRDLRHDVLRQHVAAQLCSHSDDDAGGHWNLAATAVSHQ